MLPDFPMPGATDPVTARGTPIRLQALPDSCGREVDDEADDEFELLGRLQ